MKKLLTLLIATLLTVLCFTSLTACSDGEKQSIVGTYKFHSVIMKDDTYNVGDEYRGTILTEEYYTFDIKDDNTFILTFNQDDRTESQTGTYYEWHGHYVFVVNGEEIAAELEGCYLYFIQPSMIMKFRDPNKTDKGEIDHSAEEAKFIGEYEIYSLKTTDKTTGEVKIYNLGDNLSDEVTLTKEFWKMSINKDKTFSIASQGVTTQGGNWLVYNNVYVLTRDYWSASYTAICSFEENKLLLYVIENSNVVPFLQELTLTKKV